MYFKTSIRCSGGYICYNCNIVLKFAFLQCICMALEGNSYFVKFPFFNVVDLPTCSFERANRPVSQAVQKKIKGKLWIHAKNSLKFIIFML